MYKRQVLPGGLPGATNLDAHKGLSDLIMAFAEAGKPLSAICAAPLVYGKRGLLKGKKATCYPGFDKYLDGADYTAALVQNLSLIHICQLFLQIFVRTECYRLEFYIVGACGVWSRCLGTGQGYMEIAYPLNVYSCSVLQMIGQFLAERDNGCLDVCHGERRAMVYLLCQVVGADSLPVHYTGVIPLLACTYRIG